MRREKLFDDVRAAHANVDRVEGIIDIYNRTGGVSGGCNTMYQSKEAGGSISNEYATVYTSTVEVKRNDGIKTSHDVVALMIDDGTCENPREAFLTRKECLELIRYLSTAATLLRD